MRYALTLLLLALAGPAAAQDAAETGSGLVVSYSTSVRDRAAFRRSLVRSQAPKLEQWVRDGLLDRCQLLSASYADSGYWDAMAILAFEDAAALARWKEIERTTPGGLAADALQSVTSIDTAQVDLYRARTIERPAPDSAWLVIPYEYLVGLPEYRKYFDGYVLPQLEGWIAEGALRSYALYIARHGAGRPWNALLVLEYWDESALQRRPEITAKVRKNLASDPAWAELAANKREIREEGRITIAERLLPARY